MTKFVSTFLSDESGATAIEYGLIAALIAVVIISAVTALGTTIKTKFNEVVTGLGGPAGASPPDARPKVRAGAATPRPFAFSRQGKPRLNRAGASKGEWTH